MTGSLHRSVRYITLLVTLRSQLFFTKVAKLFSGHSIHADIRSSIWRSCK
jgi:hypothetical protein